MKDNKYGILSLVAAIIGAVLIFVIVGVVPCIASVVLGIVSLIYKEKNKVMPILGIVISLVCIILLFAAFATVLREGITSVNNDNTVADYAELEKETTIERELESTEPESTAEEPESETKSVSEEPSQESEEELPTPEPQESKEEFIASCEEIPYKKLLRNPDDYIGKRLVITAEIKQIIQGGLFDSNQYYRIQTDNEGRDWFLDDEYFMYDFRVDDDMKLLDEDVITIYAEFGGMQEIKRALTKTKEEVPAIKAYYVELISE